MRTEMRHKITDQIIKYIEDIERHPNLVDEELMYIDLE